MAAAGGAIETHSNGPRNDSTLVTAWPEAFDIKNDIFKAGAADTFIRKTKSALQTRGLLAPIIERPPSVAEIQLANPNATHEQCEEAHHM